MSTSTASAKPAAAKAPRSATTGEPVTTVARRNRLGIWLCIVSDATGTVALLISYIYLWSLNVNDAWAPPKDRFADDIPFWLIVGGIILAADSVMTLLLQNGNQSLSLSCTPSQPSTHSGWLTVVYLTDT